MPEHFHFLQPLWLLALLPLALALWLISKYAPSRSPWRRLIDARLLPLLLDSDRAPRSRLPLWLLSIGWLLAVLALADPAWEQQPQPLRQTGSSRVIVLDLSRSMLATDLQPSRLVRARFKVEDILAYDAEGQTGLVVFAGDAFTVSPLTRDADTIRSQLRALHPSIMPSQGSRADLGLRKAHELLQQAEAKRGQVILIADGVHSDRTVDAARQLSESGYELAVLGVGTPAGAPIPDGHGGTLRDGTGKPVLARLDGVLLASLAEAGDGHYSELRGDQADLALLLQSRNDDPGESIDAEELQAQKWRGQGPLLAVLILPFAALAFRRGWLLSIMLCAAILVPPQPAMALSWDELWQRRDQQAARALQNGQFEQAAELAEDPARRGSALYRKQEYEQAAQEFGRAHGADGAYNQGNALARLGRYQEAISAYDQALKMQPGMEDALVNKAAIQALLEQQKRAKQESPDNQDDRESEDQQQNPDSSAQQEQQQADTGQGDEDPQEQQQGETDSRQEDTEQQEQQNASDSEGSGDQSAPAVSDTSQAAEPQAGEQNDTAQPGREQRNDSAGAGGQGDDSASEDEQSDRQQAGAQQDAAEKGPGGQVESDREDGNREDGNRENPDESEHAQAAEPRAGQQQETGPARNESENQFADANRRLDQSRDDEEAAQAESDAGRQDEGEQTAGVPGVQDRRQSPGNPEPAATARAQALNSEEQMAAQQWLRRIPDDPGGLLRRKFMYQYRQRPRRPDDIGQQEW